MQTVSTASPETRPNVSGHSLGLKTANVLQVAQRLQKGLSYAALERLRKQSGLSAEAVAAVTQIPRRTLARRKVQGKLTPQESERLYRLAILFEKTVELFEGDVAAAREWLQSPANAFAGRTPLQMAETEVGAREVEHLIGRLEHGVFA